MDLIHGVVVSTFSILSSTMHSSLMDQAAQGSIRNLSRGRLTFLYFRVPSPE